MAMGEERKKDVLLAGIAKASSCLERSGRELVLIPKGDPQTRPEDLRATLFRQFRMHRSTFDQKTLTHLETPEIKEPARSLASLTVVVFGWTNWTMKKKLDE